MIRIELECQSALEVRQTVLELANAFGLKDKVQEIAVPELKPGATSEAQENYSAQSGAVNVAPPSPTKKKKKESVETPTPPAAEEDSAPLSQNATPTSSAQEAVVEAQVKAPTKEEFQAACESVIAKAGKDKGILAVRGILSRFGVQMSRDLSANKYSEFIAACAEYVKNGTI